MQVVCIIDQTFYSHQTGYLEPSILSVWSRGQSKLLAESEANNTSLSVGGNGQGDSCEHSTT